LQISTDTIKGLREKTGAGIMDCKKALTEAKGDIEKAVQLLNERGIALAQKKSERVAEQGLIEAYVHLGGKIGVLVEVNCETDFVARTDEFKDLAHNLALQVAAMCPECVSEEEMTKDTDVDPKTACLMLQPYIKDPTKTIQEVVTEIIARTGENIKVRRFVRFELGS